MLSIIQAAGWPIWPLLACSIAALTLVIERLFSLRARKVLPPRLLDEVFGVTRASLPSADVVNKLAENSVLGQVLATGVRAVIAEPRITEGNLRDVFESAGRGAVHRLERYLNTLGTIASAAPLLGLLGTVIGMIEIFGSQSPTGGNNPALLASGISIALYNTAFGLMVAIPSLMFYRYFRGLIDGYTLDLEQACDRLTPHLMRFAVPRAARRCRAGVNGRPMAINFRKRRAEEPEINLIPFIDVLLVILIFLMLSTTYAKFTELQITLPAADADRARDRPREIVVTVSADGRFAVDRKLVEGRSVEVLAAELAQAAGGAHDRTVIISADATAAHQSVVNVMEAARRAGLPQLTFATQSSLAGEAR